MGKISTAARHISTYRLLDLVDQDEGKLETKSDYVVLCPYCRAFRGKERRKLYITKDCSVGHCWCCDSVFHNPNEYTEVFKAPTFKSEDNSISFEEVYSVDMTSYNNASETSVKGVNYLSSRPDIHIKDDYSKWGIKFTFNGAIYPITWNTDLPPVYYQIRYFEPNGKHKYFMPPIANKPFAMIQKGTTDKCIIVEGIYGGIALARANPETTVIAMLGKVLTEYHIWLFSQLNWISNYIVFLDETELSIRWLEHFKVSGLLFDTLSYIESTGFDPDEFQKYAGTTFQSKDGPIKVPRSLRKVQYYPKPQNMSFPTF